MVIVISIITRRGAVAVAVAVAEAEAEAEAAVAEAVEILILPVTVLCAATLNHMCNHLGFHGTVKTKTLSTSVITIILIAVTRTLEA